MVAPDGFWYSGLATGVLGGRYPPELDQIDVGDLASKGGRFIRDRAVRIDPSARTVHLAAGPPLTYDALSINVGSEVALARIPGAADHGYPVKPIRNLWKLRQEVETRLASASVANPLRIIVLGGGPSACEVSANLLRLSLPKRRAASLTLLTTGGRLLEQLPRGAADPVARLLHDGGVRVVPRCPAARIDADRVTTAAGECFPYDVLVHALGLVPPPLVRETGLPTDEEGSLIVDECLKSPADARVFGGGDCVAFRGRALPKVGVYAVREAPVIFFNLLATLEGRPLRRFRPQRRFLLILNLGDGTGLATWGPLYWRGRLAFLLKDRIDRAFLRKYRG